MRYVEFPSDFSRIREFTALVLADCPRGLQGGEPPRAAALRDHQERDQARQSQRPGQAPARLVRPAKAGPLHRRGRGRGLPRARTSGTSSSGSGRPPSSTRTSTPSSPSRATAGPKSDETDGGNSLIAALEYWNGGMIFNEARNKVGVVRWFSSGSACWHRRPCCCLSGPGGSTRPSRPRTSARRRPCSWRR